MRQVKTISLRRAEGPSSDPLLGEWLGFESFKQANEQLREWAYTAPDSGGYDKCDFRVIYTDSDDDNDGDTYTGRFDLTREHTSAVFMLQEQMEAVVLCYWGLRRRDRETGKLVITT